MTASFTWAVEMYIGTAWADVTEDVRTSIPVALSRGIPGVELSDRVADVGRFMFALDNSTNNSAGTLGYYSPDNDNVRTGFDLGTVTRYKLTYNGTAYYKFYGKIDAAEATFGQYKERYTEVSCVDYMNEMLVHNMKLVSVQTGKRGDQLLGTVVANLPGTPLATSYETGPDIFAYALHDIQDENTNAMAVAQRIDQSGLSYTFVTGDSYAGEKLIWQTRHTRALSTSVATFTDNMTDLKIRRKSDKIYNTIRATGYPVNLGTATETLWTSRKEIALGAGGSSTFDVSYVDPSGAGQRVSLVTGSGTVVAGTDYTMSSSSGDSGTALTANLTVTVNTWGGNAANVTLTNSAAVTGYVNLLKLRGQIIRIYEPVIVTKTDTTSKAAYGDRGLSYAMPYQDSVNTVDAFSTEYLSRLKDPHSDIDSIEFVANSSDDLMTAAMLIDVGSRITVSETVTGLSGDYFVNKYSLEYTEGKLVCRLENLESLASTGVIGVWGTNASDSTNWGAGTGVIGNWVF